jgi:hypothetical protein
MAKRSVKFSEKQLKKKFKHAQDFGVLGNPDNANVQKLKSPIQRHVFDIETTPSSGTYRGMNVVHYLNPKSRLNVIVDSLGQFHSGWKLSAAQLKHVLSTGKLGGG